MSASCNGHNQELPQTIVPDLHVKLSGQRDRDSPPGLLQGFCSNPPHILYSCSTGNSAGTQRVKRGHRKTRCHHLKLSSSPPLSSPMDTLSSLPWKAGEARLMLTCCFCAFTRLNLFNPQACESSARFEPNKVMCSLPARKLSPLSCRGIIS